MSSLLMGKLARTLAVASGLSHEAVIETKAHGTVRCRVDYARREIVQERDAAQVPMLDATPTVMLEEAAAPDNASGDVILVDARLFAVKTPLSTGKGRIRLTLEAGQDSRTEWQDNASQDRTGRVVFAGCSGPDGRLRVYVGDQAVAVTQISDTMPDGTVFETDDEDGPQFEVLGTMPWAAGWVKVTCRRVG